MEGLICCLLPAWVLKCFQFSQKVVSHHAEIEWLKCDIAVDKSGALETCFYCWCIPLLSGPCSQIRKELNPIDRWAGTGIPSSPCLPSFKNKWILLEVYHTWASHRFVSFIIPWRFPYEPRPRQRGRRSCLHMAPGACGSRLANQCESISGTSPGQTISLSAHSVCCQTPVPFRPVPKQTGTPWAAVRAHTTARHFPKRSQSSWHLGMLSPPSPPACSTNIPEGQRAARAGTARLSTCLIGVRGDRTRHRCTPSCLCNLQ